LLDEIVGLISLSVSTAAPMTLSSRRCLRLAENIEKKVNQFLDPKFLILMTWAVGGPFGSAAY
jgi:hypothetical protein